MNYITTRIEDADINMEAANAANYYIQKLGLHHLSMEVRQQMLNHLATGFAMGVRWHETKVLEMGQK